MYFFFMEAESPQVSAYSLDNVFFTLFEILLHFTFIISPRFKFYGIIVWWFTHDE